MGIDIRTFIIIIGIAHLMQVLVFSFQYKANRSLSGPGWWLMWSATECLGFGLILLRNIPALFSLVIIFQDIFIFLGGVFIYIGLLRFFEQKVNSKLIIILIVSYVVLHLFFFLVIDLIEMRTLLIDGSLAFVAFSSALIIYKNKTSQIASSVIFNISIFSIHGCIFVCRSVMIIFGASLMDVFSTSFFNLIQYFDVLIVGLLWTFGFIMMLNQRLNFEIAEAKLHFEQIFNTSPDAAVITRLSDGMYINCNEGFTKISGYTKEDYSGKTSYDINIWKDPDERDAVIKMIEEKGSCENYELLFRLKSGKVITGLMSAAIIMLKGIPHLISVTRDISNRKQKETEIQQKNEELQKINAEKDKFFSIIAHDLRSPFNSFLGLTQIMAGALPGLSMSEIQTIAVSMENSATNLYQLLENLLEWSRMEQGLIPFEPTMMKLLPIANESISLMVEPAKNKGIDLTCHISDEISVFADNNMLQTVIRNLISNALKFTPKGGTVHLSAEVDESKTVKISVQDTGIGMNPDRIDKLFRLDVQTNRKGTNGEPSSGLGLLLCKEFVEKHGGSIHIESEEGKGSTFSFTLPYSASSK